MAKGLIAKVAKRAKGINAKAAEGAKISMDINVRAPSTGHKTEY